MSKKRKTLDNETIDILSILFCVCVYVLLAIVITPFMLRSENVDIKDEVYVSTLMFCVALPCGFAFISWLFTILFHDWLMKRYYYVGEFSKYDMKDEIRRAVKDNEDADDLPNEINTIINKYKRCNKSPKTKVYTFNK